MQVRRGRRRDPLWARLIVIFGAVLMLFSGGTLVGSHILIGQATDDITQRDDLIDGAAAARGRNIDGAINMLLVGIDYRPWAAEAGARADTIVIVHIPKTHDQAYLVSIPRDWRVEISAHEKSGYRGGTDKINSAFSAGYEGGGSEIEKRARGVSLLADTLHKQTGITFNGAAIIDFAGFEDVVREMGGVNMCIDQRAQSIHLAYDRNGKLVNITFDENTKRVSGVPEGGKRVVHEIGCRRMSAKLALDYSRIRYGLPNTDYDRQRHQQQLIKAIAKEATSKGMMTDLRKLNRVISAAGKAFVLDTGGVPIADFVFTLKGVAANDLVMVKTNNGTYNGQRIGGVSYEFMSDESMAMLHAVRDGTLADFLLAHPNFISSNQAPKTS
ncbi:MAG TPA: LCP family protein [Pilimelia sp.]|nr:LCP family protein [Pilimelia sp.]